VLQALILTAVACSSASKNPEDDTQGKEAEEVFLPGADQKVALVEITGPDTSKKIVEVVLVNFLMKTGAFTLLNKKEVDKARAHHAQDPMDLNGIAKRAGADESLKIAVDIFKAEIVEGYSSEKINDPQLIEERGEEAKNEERLFKVKRLDGHVKLMLNFTNLMTLKTRTKVLEATDSKTSDEQKGAAHLPPKLRFLEELTEKALKPLEAHD